MEWNPISELPDFDQRPGRMFIRLEGSRYHSDVFWGRVYCGDAHIRKPGGDDEMIGFRASDIKRLCADGDMDEWSAKVTHWAPAIFPPTPEPR